MNCRIVPGMLLSLGLPAAAQIPPACKGPADLERALQAKPSVAAYDALGAWFGRQQRPACRQE